MPPTSRPSWRDPTGLLLSAFSSGALRDYGRDRLGSLTAMVNTAGVVDNAYQYDPWGQRITNTGTAVNPFKFSAGYQSTNSGLFDFAARTYDPATGRFTQADPRPSSVVEPNRFAYVGCNPTNATDPSGLAQTYCWFMVCRTIFTTSETMQISLAMATASGLFWVASELGLAPGVIAAILATSSASLAWLASSGGHLETISGFGVGVSYPAW